MYHVLMFENYIPNVATFLPVSKLKYIGTKHNYTVWFLWEMWWKLKFN